MIVSDARCEASRRNAARSTGPKTPEGKARSRGNAIKHGLTGEGVALPDEVAAEVERLQESFEAELRPSGEVGRTLVRRLALLAVRMERGATHETASLAEHVREAEADFDAEWPEVEGKDDPNRERLRVEAAHRALFDPSQEATLARKYEAAAERCFFLCLKELRQVEREAKAESAGPKAGAAREALGSFLPVESIASVLKSLPAEPARVAASAPPVASKPAPSARELEAGGSSFVPIAIGRVG